MQSTGFALFLPPFDSFQCLCLVFHSCTVHANCMQCWSVAWFIIHIFNVISTHAMRFLIIYECIESVWKLDLFSPCIRLFNVNGGDITGLSRIMICFTQSCMAYLTFFIIRSMFIWKPAQWVVFVSKHCASAKMWMHLLDYCLLIVSWANWIDRFFYNFIHFQFTWKFYTVFFHLLNYSRFFLDICNASEKLPHKIDVTIGTSQRPMTTFQ